MILFMQQTLSAEVSGHILYKTNISLYFLQFFELYAKQCKLIRLHEEN